MWSYAAAVRLRGKSPQRAATTLRRNPLQAGPVVGRKPRAPCSTGSWSMISRSSFLSEMRRRPSGSHGLTFPLRRTTSALISAELTPSRCSRFATILAPIAGKMREVRSRRPLVPSTKRKYRRFGGRRDPGQPSSAICALLMPIGALAGTKSNRNSPAVDPRGGQFGRSSSAVGNITTSCDRVAACRPQRPTGALLCRAATLAPLQLPLALSAACGPKGARDCRVVRRVLLEPH